MDVLILLGSESDLDVGNEAAKVFDEMNVRYEMHVASAHRTPDKVKSLILNAESMGAQVVIAGAGMAAHLAGVAASETLLPVIGIPMAVGPLNGLDALLAMVNMPGGVPVGTVSLGRAGGQNAAMLAMRILALGNEELADKLKAHRQSMTHKVEEADKRLQEALAARR